MARRSDHFAPWARRMAVSGLRANNERAVLATVVGTPGVSAAEIARATGLGAQSVSRMLTELEGQGLVRRGEARRGRRGQPAVPIYIDPQGAFCIGCEIGWRHLNVMLRDLGGNTFGQHRRDYPLPDATTIVDEVASLCGLLLGLVPEKLRDRVVGVGLAMPGGISRNIDLFGADAAQTRAWANLDIRGELEERLGLSVFLYNDGNAACWGQLADMAMPRPANMALIHVGTFVGAGILADGRLWEGSTGNGGNIGSMVVTEENGRPNFVHLIASIYALEQRLKAAGIAVPSGRPANWDWDALGPAVDQWLSGAAKAIAKAILNTSAVMEFGVAIIDGAMARPVVDRLTYMVRDELAALPTLTSDRPRIIEGTLGDDGAAKGASIIPIYRRFFSREYDDIVGD